MARYKIFVEQIRCDRDQSTRLFNFEGKLELQAQFTVNGVSVGYPGAFGSRENFQLNQGESAFPNLALTEVEYSGGLNPVSILTEIRELEFGAQGDDDQGKKEDSIVLNGADAISKVITIDISADNRKERGGKVSCTITARKI